MSALSPKPQLSPVRSRVRFTPRRSNPLALVVFSAALRAAGAAFGVPTHRILSHCRHPQTAAARRVAVRLCLRFSDAFFQEISERFGLNQKHCSNIAFSKPKKPEDAEREAQAREFCRRDLAR